MGMEGVGVGALLNIAWGLCGPFLVSPQAKDKKQKQKHNTCTRVKWIINDKLQQKIV